MGIERFQEPLSRLVQGKMGEIEASEDAQKEKVTKVATQVFEIVSEAVFPPELRHSFRVHFSAPLEKQEEIFNRVMEIKKGESCESALIEIAKLCAQLDGRQTAANIQKFGITDQAALVEIAKLCAQQSGGGTAANIQNFGITDQAALVEIAKICAQQDGGATAQCIQNFGITDQAALVEIAKICAQQNGAQTAANIQNFGIADQAARVEIAKLCMLQNGTGTAIFFQNFGIADQAALVEIAKLYAQQKDTKLAQVIQNLGIADQAALVEIAKLSAQNNGSNTAQFIQNFGITDPSALVEIARLCAQQNGGATAEFIQNFRIEDQATLIEILMLCAQRDAIRTALWIRNFGTLDPATIVEIAKLCAQQSGREGLRVFQKYVIENHTPLVAIAILCAQQNGAVTAANIQSFGITDQATLIEIAKLCAQQNGGGTAANIQNFGIRDPAALIEIAKLCAQQDGAGTARCIQNFGITDQSALVEIAMICAQQDGVGTAANIQNFGITDQTALVEIAKFCARQNGGGTAEFIRNFGIKDQAALIEIAMICAQQDGVGTASCIQEFGIADPAALTEIGFQCILYAPSAFFSGAEDSPFRSFPREVSEKLSAVCSAAQDPALVQNIRQDLGEKWDFLSKSMELSANREQLVTLFAICKGMGKMEVLRREDVPELVRFLTTFRLPLLKPFLFRSLIDLVYHNRVAEFVEFTKGFAIPTKPAKRQVALICMLALFGMPNLEPALKVHLLQDFLENLKKRTTFLEASGKTGAFVHFARLLNDKIPDDKEGVCATFLSYGSSDEFSRGIFLLSGAVASGIDPSHKSLAEVQQMLSERVRFPEGFGTILEALRRPESLFIYGTKVNQLPANERERLQETMATWFREVLDGSFYEQRYAQSPQVKAMKDMYCPVYGQESWNTLMDKWRSKVSQPLSDFLPGWPGYTVENTDNHWDLFLCGTEVAGSCQHVGGTPDLNKNLLGYVVDGKVRMIAIKDDTGRIVTRSIVKLLWDDASKKPVLLLEKVYSNNSKLDLVIEQMARKEADRLKIKLETGKAEDRRFQSYPNRSGFEYEDSKVVEQVPVS